MQNKILSKKSFVPETGYIDYDIHSYPSLVSTNQTAREMAEKGSVEGAVVWAAEQTAGRGRFNRTWVSPKGGLYFSVILTPGIETPAAGVLTLAGALSVAEALKEIAGLCARIKWPNDIHFSGKKICGILTEGTLSGANPYIVIGVGININNRFSELPPEAISLREATGRDFSIAEVLKTVLEKFEPHYRKIHGNAAYQVINEYKSFCETLGMQVRFSKGDISLTGLAEDIDEDGALLIRDSLGNLKKIYSGEITCLRQK